MKKPLKTIVVALASFADGYNHNSTILKIASSVLGGGRYIMNPELRAKQVNICWCYIQVCPDSNGCCILF